MEGSINLKSSFAFLNALVQDLQILQTKQFPNSLKLFVLKFVMDLQNLKLYLLPLDLTSNRNSFKRQTPLLSFHLFPFF